MLDPHFSQVRDACIQGQTIFFKKKSLCVCIVKYIQIYKHNKTKKNGMIGRLLGEYQN